MTRLYVGNLPYNATEAELSNYFSACGKVTKSVLVTDRETGKARGFGFVDMESAEEAQKAIETLNGTEFQGRALVVNEAKPREERRPNSGHHGHSHRQFGGRGEGHQHGGFDEGKPSRNRWQENRDRHQRRRGFGEED